MNDLAYPKAIIFDWDNTLVDSWPVIQDALNTTFRKFGLKEWGIDEVREKVRESLRDSFPKYFGAEWKEAGKVFNTRYAEIHSERLTPVPNSEKMLSLLFDLDLAYYSLLIISDAIIIF